MKTFTITFESDEHCEAIAKRKGYQAEVTVEKADTNGGSKVIPNPEAPDEYLKRMLLKGYNENLAIVAKEKAAEQAKATLDTKAAEYIAKGAVTIDSK